MRAAGPIALLALLAGGCAADAPVQGELERLERQGGDGITQVKRALEDPTFSELGAGLGHVETAVRELEMIETDSTVPDDLRLRATLLQAKIWSDLVTVLESSANDVLADKADPPRRAAEDALERAAVFMTHE